MVVCKNRSVYALGGSQQGELGLDETKDDDTDDRLVRSFPTSLKDLLVKRPSMMKLSWI